MDGVLGDCPHYYVMFVNRGTEEYIGRTEFDSLYFSRVLDNVSAATIIIGESKLIECSEILGTIEPWKHEVVIVRGNEVVWQGPISDEINYSQGNVTITAQDILTWFNYRRVTLDKQYVNEDVGVVFRDLVEDAMRRDPSPNIEPIIERTSARIDRTYESARRQRTLNALLELMRFSVDATVVGRDLYVRGQESPIADLGTLPMGTYRGINIRVRGSDMANDVLVTATASTGGEIFEGRWSSEAYAPEDIREYGLLEGQTSNFIITSEDTARQAAETRWDFTRRPTTYVQLTLQPTAPIPMNRIIPGSVLSLRDNSTPKKLNDRFRISRADFQLVAGSEGTQTEVAQIIVTNEGTFSQAVL